ncbi:hypothetical protein COY23_00600, partial [bacterium (Candidatus Torokbacteria) CG_4_10_14_0_2_um_filter_35_8]
TDEKNKYIIDKNKLNIKGSFKELVQHYKGKQEEAQNIGRVMHKYLEYYAMKRPEILLEMEKIEREMGLTKKDIALYREVAKNFYDKNIALLLKGKDYMTELVVILPGLKMAFNDGTNDVQGSIAGALDIVIKTRGGHIYKLIDYKTGYLKTDDISHGVINYSKDKKDNTMMLYNNSYTMAMLKVVLNALQFKASVDRDARFEDIALYKMNIEKGNDIRKYSLMDTTFSGNTNELSKYLHALENFFKEEHFEYWKENKDLFDAEKYIAPQEEV